MPKEIKIQEVSNNPSISLALDTISSEKQCLAFVNTKMGAEKLAEDISKKIKDSNQEWLKLSKTALKAISSPTKQCRRLAGCLEKGIAFHHAGLASKQRELIEDNFRDGTIKVICSTPTLAFGLDLPAYRVIIRDLKRFGAHGMDWIPVLEYHQQSGRAGRPKYDKIGQSIAIAKTETEKDVIHEKYVLGDAEDILSKLAVAPVLRTYLLSLIASEFINSRDTAIKFFEKTFWAHQFKDMRRLNEIIDNMLELLEEWEFISSGGEKSDDMFVSADKIDNNKDKKLSATRMGKRISELYIDPLTAHFFINCIEKAKSKSYKKLELFPILQMVSHTLEMRPLLSLRTKDVDIVEDELNKQNDYLLDMEPSPWEPDYDEFLSSIKTAMFINDWTQEKDEEYLLETYNIRPGEIRAKLDTADWLLYATEEIIRIMKFAGYRSEIVKTRLMLKHGVKEELLPLIRLKNIGRVRARKLYNNKVRNIADIKKADLMKLVQILGKETAYSIKKQVDQDFNKAVTKENKRKGQISIVDYSKKRKI